MTAIILYIIAGVLLAAAFVLVISLIQAPDGHEDADGFHLEGRNAPLWNQREIANPAPESPSLNS